MTVRNLVTHLLEAGRVWLYLGADVVFRDKEGVERPIAKVKVSGRHKVVICEDADG